VQSPDFRTIGPVFRWHAQALLIALVRWRDLPRFPLRLAIGLLAGFLYTRGTLRGESASTIALPFVVRREE
jgi:hypothetical protein